MKKLIPALILLLWPLTLLIPTFRHFIHSNFMWAYPTHFCLFGLLVFLLFRELVDPFSKEDKKG